MLWLKYYNDKVNKNTLLSSIEKLAFLKRIVDKEVQTIVSQVERNFELYTEEKYVDMIHDHRIRLDTRAECDTNDKIRSYFAANRSAAYKKEQLDHIIAESIYHLMVNIFGNERFGLSTFI